ncbi:MAG: ankyrin repeat domain-containing protein [Opitutaceae bacterium]
MNLLLPVRSVAVLVLCCAVSMYGGSSDDLLKAVRTRDTKTWRFLLREPVDVTRRDESGATALHYAALNHDVVAVEALLAAGAEANARNAAAATPLLYGAGHAEIVRLLLAAGAVPDARSLDQATPLSVAVGHADGFESVQRLLAAGVDLRAAGLLGRTPLLNLAMESGDQRMVDLLLAKGVEIDPEKAQPPLANAAFLGDLTTVRALLDRGADLNRNAGFAGHALNFALYAGHMPVALELIERGSDLSLRSPRGHGTPPMVWTAYNQQGDPSAARLLVARGVDPQVANDAGVTAMDFAVRTGPQSPLSAYLRSVGAKEPVDRREKRIPQRDVPDSWVERQRLVRERVPAALKLLQQSSRAFLNNGFVQKARCVSCHGQNMTAVAVAMASERGFAVDEGEIGQSLTAHRASWAATAERARQMRAPLPDVFVSAGYGFFGLSAVRYPRDDTTDAMVRYLLRAQRRGGEWPGFDRRPPMEDGPIVATAWAALAVRDYPPEGYGEEVTDSQARSAAWLARQQPEHHNERVFQLLGLRWSGVTPENVDTSRVHELKQTQRADGGWAQLPDLNSDAWATGLALYALHEAGGIPVTDPVYQRGVAYLLRSQFEDGSWWVRSRSWPFQPHFNGQFPHGKDQWISQGATAWATLALLLTLEPLRPAPSRPTAQAQMEAWDREVAASKRAGREKAVSQPVATPSVAVDFGRDIQPIFKRSCAECHGEKKTRGGFSLASRDLLLKGGASGEPAISPGYAEESTLIHYVAGQFEDLEMPPLDRRDSYPPLTAAEIELLRVWIESGAPWTSATDQPALPEPSSGATNR